MANNDIPDELLADYLDGNTNETETMEVLDMLKNNPELQEMLEIALSLDEEDNPYDTLPMMRLAAESGSHICGVLCEVYVLHRRNVSFDEKESVTSYKIGT